MIEGVEFEERSEIENADAKGKRTRIQEGENEKRREG